MLRYPEIARLEHELQTCVKALALGPRVRVAFPPAFEGDEVTLEVRVKSTRKTSTPSCPASGSASPTGHSSVCSICLTRPEAFDVPGPTFYAAPPPCTAINRRTC